VATDARTGHDVLLSEGDAVEATLASAAIPAVYPTIRWADTRLMDGGMANNTPLSHAIDLGAERI
jgi:NTE family protein